MATSDPFSGSGAPSGGGIEALVAAALSSAQADAANTQQLPRPYYTGLPTKKVVNRWRDSEMPGRVVAGRTNGRVDWGIHDNSFLDKWNNDRAWRERLVKLGLGSGLPNMTKNAGAYDFYKVWQAAGELSSQWADQGRNVTPMQVLEFLAGVNGKAGKAGSGGSGGSGGGGGGGGTATNVSTSYDISNPETAKALTNAVLQAALGREATDAELASYRAALNAAEKSNPTVTRSTMRSSGNSSSSSSTTTGGLDSAGKQQVLLDKARATAEGQAYQTNDVFNKALEYLAGQ